MSSTDSSEDHVMADTGPSGSRGTMEADHLLQRSLATYRYENALVKTELSATLERHAREMEELKLKYETQLREAERQRIAAESQLSEVQDAQTEKQRKLQQANLQLQQKIKVMEEEVEAGVRALDKMVKEKTKAEEELQQHTLSQQTALQALKGEKNQLRETVDYLRGELDKERTTTRELTTTLNSERHQQQLIKSRLSEVEQQCRVQLTAAQNEVSQLHHVKDQEAAAASKRINELMSTVEEEKSVLSRVKERSVAKELELEKRITEERQSHLSSSHQLAQQNSQLHDQLKKVRNYGSLIKKLRFKLEIGVVQVEQLEAQRAALQDNVPANVYRHLQSQLQDITRKHNEFAAFIRGLSEFQATLPEMAELTTSIGAVGEKLSELEVDQLHCLSELESL